MTIKEFEDYNKTLSMPQEWIGQGWGYKVIDRAWKDISLDEIIYISEYAYEENNYVKRENAYSRRDIQNVVRYAYPELKEKYVDELAAKLFDAIDWQFPESSIDEDWLLSEDEWEYYEIKR